MASTVFIFVSTKMQYNNSYLYKNAVLSNAQQAACPPPRLRWKSHLKNLTRKHRKIDRKSIKNRRKIGENRGLEGVWADSRFQARLGRRLGGP